MMQLLNARLASKAHLILSGFKKSGSEQATVGEPATESTAPNANWRNMVEIIKKPKFLFVVQVV
jgi:hypothetical protein